MRPRTVFRQLSLSILPLALLLVLAACGQRADRGTAASGGDASTSAAADQNPGRGKGRRHEPKGHITLAGAMTFDGDLPMTCDTFPDKGLVFIFGQPGTPTPETEVRIGSFATDGEYLANVVIRDQPAPGSPRSWTGTVKIQVQSHVAGGMRKRTAFNGTFSGTYQGNTGGTGTLNGQFQRCAIRGVAQ